MKLLTTLLALFITATPALAQFGPGIFVGDSIKLEWKRSVACTASGAWSGNKPASGSQYVKPTTTATYTLKCGTWVWNTVVLVDALPAPPPVQPPPPPLPPPPTSGASLDWFSDWHSGTGTGLTATQDNGKFNDYCCTGTPPSLFTIVPATGLGFPSAMANVARIDGDINDPRKMMEAADESPMTTVAPNVGEYQFYRWYFRNAVGTGIENGGAHVIESHIGWIAWAFKPLNMQSNGTYQVNLFLNRTNSYTDFWTSPVFQKNVTYRWELRLFRVDATHFQASAIVTGPDDVTVIATDAAFINVNDPTTVASALMPIQNLDQDLRSVDVGQPNQAGSDWTSGNYMYVGGMAIRKSASVTAWIGPYPTGGEP